MGVMTLTLCGIDQSQSNMKRIIHCNWSIFYGVRLTTPIVDDPLGARRSQTSCDSQLEAAFLPVGYSFIFITVL